VKLQLPYLLSFENPTKNIHFILLDGLLVQSFYGALSYGAYWDDLPEMIIVGISQNKNNERIEDSTYDEADNVPQKRS
jgi:hypothetical protein